MVLGDRVHFNAIIDTIFFRVLSDKLFFRVHGKRFLSAVFSGTSLLFYQNSVLLLFLIKSDIFYCFFRNFNKTDGEKHEEILVL